MPAKQFIVNAKAENLFKIAVVFRTVRYNLNGMECLYTDGGILDQYPIHCFDGNCFASFKMVYYGDPDYCIICYIIFNWIIIITNN